jgi:E1A/CREB-binding protein
MQALKQRHQLAVQQNQMSGPSSTQAPAPTSSALTQPAQPGSAPAVTPVEPAPKRLKPNSGLPVAPGVPAFVQRQHGALRQQVVGGQKGVAIPIQPVNPNLKPGYVYSRPQGTAPGAAVAKPGVPGLAYSNGQVIMPKHSGPKPQEDHTLINCFTVEQIETHIASLNTGLQLSPQKLKTKCLDLMKVLQSHHHGWVFNSPVDPVELGLPDYFEVVKKPMDLGTIKKKLENGCYHSIGDFESHVNLTFDNAMLYNPEGSVVYNMAKEMKDKFAIDYAQLIKQLNIEEEEKRKNGEACLLCGCEKLLFEPPIFYCNGMNCPSKRIRRNSYYYVAGNNQYHWCHQCFGELRDNQILELGDVTVKKEHMVKKKNDENHEESWVQCDKCERWIHQICALFNTRQNKDQRSEFTCPRCTVEERKKKGTTEGTSTTPMAEDLPRTKLSQRLETHVRKKVDEYFAKCAKEKSEMEVSDNGEEEEPSDCIFHITLTLF